MKKLLFVFLVFILLMGFSEASTIYGNVYELSLKKAENARIEINSTPRQFMVAQNGTYQFNVPHGNYRIKGQLFLKTTLIAEIDENITVNNDGSYVLDLILFPDLEEGIENLEFDVEENLIESNETFNFWSMALFVLVAIAIAIIFLYYFYWKEPGGVKPRYAPINTRMDDGLSQILKILEQEHGRATQKEIRAHFPLSEAKISLMIAELEHKGLVQKIKKGRGNIIVLKKSS